MRSQASDFSSEPPAVATNNQSFLSHLNIHVPESQRVVGLLSDKIQSAEHYFPPIYALSYSTTHPVWVACVSYRSLCYDFDMVPRMHSMKGQGPASCCDGIHYMTPFESAVLVCVQLRGYCEFKVQSAIVPLIDWISDTCPTICYCYPNLACFQNVLPTYLVQFHHASTKLCLDLMPSTVFHMPSG